MIRSLPRARSVAAGFACLVALAVAPARVSFADQVTPTVTVSPEATWTPIPLPSPTKTAVPTSTPVPPEPVTVRPETHRVRHTPTPRPTKTHGPRKTAKHVKVVNEKRHSKKHHHARPKATATKTATPTATPTPTPPISLNTEDSVSPVTCNGAKKPLPTRPFLSPPYRGWTSMVTFFDHDSPNFAQDGLMVTTTGAQAAPDSEHRRTDFPAYWDSAVRQYLDYDGHNGYDFDLSYQPVYAAASGKVIFAAFEYPDAPDHGYGQMVMIDHRNGYVTLYGHFSRIMVKVGQKVHRGQRIGISGNTGHSTGPHLHFTVFHNCSPTDPYGWSGSGPDPLSGYQGETSIPLWKEEPLITNPLPAWPGMAGLAGIPGERRLLLRLPSPRGGTRSFEGGLRARAHTVLTALARYHVTGKADMLHGSVDTAAALDPSVAYRIPDVVSIEAPDSVDGSRAQVIASLAHAALASLHRVQHLDRARSWTGYLVSWAGRTLLVGTGTKGREVALRLPASSDRTRVERLRADAKDGTYAVDLGHLSAAEYSKLKHELRTSTRKVSSVLIQPPAAARQLAPRTVRGPESTSAGWLILPVLLFMGGLAAGVTWRARRA